MKTVAIAISAGASVGAAAGMLAAFYGRGNFEISLLSIAMAVLYGMPALVTAGICWTVYKLRNSRKARGIALFASAWAAAFLVPPFVAVPAGEYLQRKDIRSAKRYCESLIPAIEEYQSRYAVFPNSLEDIGNVPPPPRLLRDDQFYGGVENQLYWFSFHVSDSFMGSYRSYDTQTGRWPARKW